MSLRALRIGAGRAQYEIGKLLGLSPDSAQAHIARLEAGRGGDPSLDTVLRYVQACGGRVGEFFGQMEDDGVLPGVGDVARRSAFVARERKARAPVMEPADRPEPAPDPREAAREAKRRNTRMERKLLAALRAALCFYCGFRASSRP